MNYQLVKTILLGFISGVIVTLGESIYILFTLLRKK
jgi:hypothetical protein